MKKIKPLATFRVYPSGRYFYAVVNIWPTKTAMYAHKPLQRNHEASCTGQEAYDFSRKIRRKSGLFAELNFHSKFLGVGCVSHEITHATFCWADRVRLPLDSHALEKQWNEPDKGGVLPNDGSEERFCYALGDMVKQFTAKCYKLGLYK